jgi:hypothetical protein
MVDKTPSPRTVQNIANLLCQPFLLYDNLIVSHPDLLELWTGLGLVSGDVAFTVSNTMNEQLPGMAGSVVKWGFCTSLKARNKNVILC